MARKFSEALCAICFFLFAFFPVLQIGEFNIPTILLLAPLLLFRKKFYFERKVFLVSLFSVLALSLLFLPVILFGQSFSYKDATFILFPLYMCCIYHVIVNVFNLSNIGFLEKCLKVFLIIQLLFCFMQLTNFLNTNTIFEKVYYYWQSTNAQKMANYLEVSYRPFGTMGSPIILSIVSYLFGLLLLKINKRNKWYYYLSILIVVISGARMPLLAILLIELYRRVLKNVFKNPIRSMMILSAIIIVSFLAIKYVPFLNHIFESYLFGDANVLSDYSVSYRLGMVDMAKENLQYMVFGGYGSSNFPTYVDSEVILRLMEFGIVNMVFIMSFYLYKFFVRDEYCDRDDRATINSAFCFLLICSITSVVFTNFMISQFIVASLFIIEKERKERLASLCV